MVTAKFTRVWVALIGAMLVALAAGPVSAQTCGTCRRITGLTRR